MIYVQIKASGDLPSLAALGPFKAVVIVDDDVSPARRSTISDWLVASGCLYLMAWGEACEAWHDAVDHANSAAHDFPEEIPDEHLIVTTWHADESLKDVFWFSKHTAMHPCAELHNTVLVHIAVSERERELTEIYEAA